MEIDRSELGRRGEELAIRWFLEHRPGARLLARNFRCKQGEIDFVAREGSPPEIVFVEVRYRSERAWVDALSSITYGKRLRIRRAMELFLARHAPELRGAKGVRLDVLALDSREGRLEVRHYLNIDLGSGERLGG